ncbi:MAG: hypothetical protein ACP5G1_01125 [Nanopusillaceae archaeon]
MFLRSASLWVEFLLYTAVAITILAFTLYYVRLSVQNQQSQIDLKYTVNLLSSLNYQIEQISSCYSCNYRFFQQLPNGLTIYVYPGRINAVYISTVNYTLSLPNYISLNVKRTGYNAFLYNFTLNTVPFNLQGASNYTFTDNICLLLNKTPSGYYISKC